MALPLLLVQSDAHILDRMRNGDEGALDILYRTNRSAVMSYVVRNSGNRDDADDLLQEALVILWERVRTGRYSHDAKLSTFLYATVRNIWLRRLSRRKFESTQEIDPEAQSREEPTALEELIASERGEHLQKALERLGEPCRSLLLLFYWEEQSMDEIARRLGFANADTAKSKKYQCKKALRDLIEGMGTGHD